MRAWPIEVRLGAVATAIVAGGSAVLSWDALSWGARQLGVDARLCWLYPVVVDGTIAMGTVAALALRGARHRVRAYVWALLSAAIAASVVGNGAHAAGGSALHVAGAAVPAVALAASLHLLVVLVRASQRSPARADARTTARAQQPRSARARRRAPPGERVELPDGRSVSPGHARKLRAQERRRLEVSDAA